MTKVVQRILLFAIICLIGAHDVKSQFFLDDQKVMVSYRLNSPIGLKYVDDNGAIFPSFYTNFGSVSSYNLEWLKRWNESIDIGGGIEMESASGWSYNKSTTYRDLSMTSYILKLPVVWHSKQRRFGFLNRFNYYISAKVSIGESFTSVEDNKFWQQPIVKPDGEIVNVFQENKIVSTDLLFGGELLGGCSYLFSSNYGMFVNTGIQYNHTSSPIHLESNYSKLVLEFGLIIRLVNYNKYY